MARRLADDGDVGGTPRRSVADLLREAGIDENTAPRRRRRFIEEDEEPTTGEPSDDVPQAPAPASDPVPEAESVPEVESDSAAERARTPEADLRPEAEPDSDGQAKSPIDRVDGQAPYAEPAGVPDESGTPEAAAALPTKPAREHSGAAHWTLAIGEVILATAIGVGLSFVFRLLWDIAPYAAAVLAPVVICAVVAIVGFSRKKMGLGSIPLSLLLLVLFVTALLVVIPAAWVLTSP